MIGLHARFESADGSRLPVRVNRDSVRCAGLGAQCKARREWRQTEELLHYGGGSARSRLARTLATMLSQCAPPNS